MSSINPINIFYVLSICHIQVSNMLNYYAPVIYQDQMSLSRELSRILGGCTEVTYLVGSVLPLFVIDKFGRRLLLMFSPAGLCLCFVMVSILLSIRSRGTAYGATAFIFLFQLFYPCTSTGLLTLVQMASGASTRYRAKVQAISSAWNWMFVFVVVKVSQQRDPLF